jgi:hypothetical protein
MKPLICLADELKDVAIFAGVDICVPKYRWKRFMLIPYLMLFPLSYFCRCSSKFQCCKAKYDLCSEKESQLATIEAMEDEWPLYVSR